MLWRCAGARLAGRRMGCAGTKRGRPMQSCKFSAAAVPAADGLGVCKLFLGYGLRLLPPHGHAGKGATGPAVAPAAVFEVGGEGVLRHTNTQEG